MLVWDAKLPPAQPFHYFTTPHQFADARNATLKTKKERVLRPAVINAFVRLSVAFNSPALFHKNCVTELGEQGFPQRFWKGKKPSIHRLVGEH